MKTIAVMLALTAAAASAALVVPDFKELRPGVYVNVLKRAPTAGAKYPTYEVTFYNMNDQEVTVSAPVFEYLPQALDMGIMEMRSENEYRATTDAGSYIPIRLPAHQPRVYSFTKKFYSGYN